MGISMIVLFMSMLIVFIEVWGSFFFFDTFMRGKTNGKWKYRYVLYFFFLLLSLAGSFIGMWKVPFCICVLILYCRKYYDVSYKQGFFFSCLNYCMIFLVDFVAMPPIRALLSPQDEKFLMKAYMIIFGTKILWVAVLVVLRKIWRLKDDFRDLSNRDWLKLSSIPSFSLIALLAMYHYCNKDEMVLGVCFFIAVGLIGINIIVIQLLQDILEKGEMLRISTLTNQKAKNQLAVYRDMQSVYERQGRKLHDYKNQLRTIQTLMKAGDVQTAISFVEKLTESISVEMSAINTNHPVVNAVLNQKYHTAQEKQISMIFKVGDVHEIALREEEIVILLSNLLDNAIRESERVIKAGREAVIHIKMVCEDKQMILSVKNPVLKKVEMAGNTICNSVENGHGIGLLNIQSVVEKYGGDFVLDCDEKEFCAVVIIKG